MVQRQTREHSSVSSEVRAYRASRSRAHIWCEAERVCAFENVIVNDVGRACGLWHVGRTAGRSDPRILYAPPPAQTRDGRDAPVEKCFRLLGLDVRQSSRSDASPHPRPATTGSHARPPGPARPPPLQREQAALRGQQSERLTPRARAACSYIRRRRWKSKTHSSEASFQRLRRSH